MGLFSSFRVAPGVRLSTSSRELRAHVGPRFARLHVGGDGTGVSTGAGPFTLYETLDSPSTRRPPSRSTVTSTPGQTPAQAERVRQVAEVARPGSGFAGSIGRRFHRPNGLDQWRRSLCRCSASCSARRSATSCAA